MVSYASRFRTMHLERANGIGVACCSKIVPATWHRTSNIAEVNCARCRVVHNMAQKKLSSVEGSSKP